MIRRPIRYTSVAVISAPFSRCLEKTAQLPLPATRSCSCHAIMLYQQQMRPLWLYVWVAFVMFATIAGLAGYVHVRDWSTNLDLFFQNVVLTLIAAGAVVAASYSYWSSDIAWRNYEESRKPRILVSVVTKFPTGNANAPQTRFNCRNFTTNSFDELYLRLEVQGADKTADLSDLFSQPMMLPAGDERLRQFDTYAELSKRGFDLEAIAQTGARVRLVINYSYRHHYRLLRLRAQSYLWNAAIQQWEIE